MAEMSSGDLSGDDLREYLIRLIMHQKECKAQLPALEKKAGELQQLKAEVEARIKQEQEAFNAKLEQEKAANAQNPAWQPPVFKSQFEGDLQKITSQLDPVLTKKAELESDMAEVEMELEKAKNPARKNPNDKASELLNSISDIVGKTPDQQKTDKNLENMSLNDELQKLKDKMQKKN